MNEDIQPGICETLSESLNELSSLDFQVDLTTLLESFKNTLKTIDSVLNKRFSKGAPAYHLVPLKALMIDRVLVRAWQQTFSGSDKKINLVAVGGYGRGELHPGSDIDILILLDTSRTSKYKPQIEKFLTFLWDIGLEIGHSVRTIKECKKEAVADITVATNIMEARLLCGDTRTFEKMRKQTGPDSIWPCKKFYLAKYEEQSARHQKYNDSAYGLEPNLKEGIGGLRDIQTVIWVAKRHLAVDNLSELQSRELLTPEEFEDLVNGRNFLWQVRFGLHIVAGRREDRLLFDHQKKLAVLLGYEDDEQSLAVEKMMQTYFRTVKDISRLNEMLLQYFHEEILFPDERAKAQKINSRFQIRCGFIETTNENVFKRNPFAMLEIFLHTLQTPEIKGISANTIRQIRAHRHLIDEKCRNDIRSTSLFMEILRQPTGVSHELMRMHNYGVLSAYIPAFDAIEGRMQWDLFHTLTVDSHILTMVRNLRRFAAPNFADEFPFCSKISRRLPKPELLYIAGLFHDIAKGRGGDHSTLGAVDVYDFCKRHSLSEYDAQLVSWLVRHHLLMSMTAQRKDISDPEVVSEFCQVVGDRNRLDYLYLMTVADIRATNPELWNSWRSTLLRELFISAHGMLRKGLKYAIDEEQLVEENKASARRLLNGKKIHHMKIKAFWRDLPAEYFIRFSPQEISWHTENVAGHDVRDLPIVISQKEGARGGTEIFVYDRDRPKLFALMCSCLEQMNLSILDARILTSSEFMTLDNYLVVEMNGEPVSDDTRLSEITQRIRSVLLDPQALPVRPQRRMPRALKHFDTPTKISCSYNESGHKTILEISTGDRPGLLSLIGQAFIEADIHVENAKVATIGERAEDIFIISDKDHEPIRDETHIKTIENVLMQWLDNDDDKSDKPNSIDI